MELLSQYSPYFPSYLTPNRDDFKVGDTDVSKCAQGLLMILLGNLRFSAFFRSKNGGAPSKVYNESDITGGNRVTCGCYNTTRGHQRMNAWLRYQARKRNMVLGLHAPGAGRFLETWAHNVTQEPRTFRGRKQVPRCLSL